MKCRPQAGFFIVRNNPIQSENQTDSLANTGASGISLSDGAQFNLTSSDDEVGGQVGGQDGRQGKTNG